eukprot:1151471-Pelagomonas_calceolata.AAC.1
MMLQNTFPWAEPLPVIVLRQLLPSNFDFPTIIVKGRKARHEGEGQIFCCSRVTLCGSIVQEGLPTPESAYPIQDLHSMGYSMGPLPGIIKKYLYAGMPDPEDTKDKCGFYVQRLGDSSAKDSCYSLSSSTYTLATAFAG